MTDPIFDTAFTRKLGVTIPIAQAPVGEASTPAMVAAVANAGGLGTLSITWRDPETLPALLREVRSLTGRPVAVNLVLHWDPEERLRIALAEGFRVVSFFWGDPAPWIEPVKAAGGIVMHTVGSAAEARRVVDAGVDVVVAQGWEAGGHVWGEVSTLALVPRVADAVAGDAVVLAAGGITDGRGLAAALALGADGVWMGTRFLMAEEATTHPAWQDALVAAEETDTLHGVLFDGGWEDAPLRSLRNATVAAWEAAGRPPHGQRPGEGETIATGEDGREISRYGSDGPILGASGGVDQMCLYAGQGVGLLARRQPAGEIVREVATEAARVLRGLAGSGDAPSPGTTRRG